MENRREARARWKRLVARFEDSGKSQAVFTAEAGVSLPAFRHWLYRIRREDQAGAPAPPRRLKAVRLVPVEVLRSAQASGHVELRTAGVRIRVPVGTDPDYLAQVAAALRKTAAC